MKLILTTICFLLFSFILSAQTIPGYLYYNTIQDNAAYAGQDSFSINLSANLNADYLKPKKEQLNLLYRQSQLFTSFDLKKINSGVGIYAGYNAFGSESENIYEQQYRAGIIYNYNLIFSNNLNVRIGGQLNGIIEKDVYHINTIFPYWYQSPADGNEIHEITKSDITIDPAVWVQYDNFNAGFTVKNISNNDIESRVFSLNAFYDRIKTRSIDIILAVKIIQYQYQSDFISHANFGEGFRPVDGGRTP